MTKEFIGFQKLDPIRVVPVIPPPIDKVLKVRVSGSLRHSRVYKYFNETWDDIWYTAKIWIPQATIDNLAGINSGRLISNMTSSGSIAGAAILAADPFTIGEEITGPVWYEDVPTVGSPPPDYPVVPVADVPHIVEMNRNADGTNELYVNDVLAFVGEDSYGSLNTEYIGFGQWEALLGAPEAIYYFSEVSVGTSRGASDIYSDDFESGDLSAWEYTAGDVSVIDNPF